MFSGKRGSGKVIFRQLRPDRAERQFLFMCTVGFQTFVMAIRLGWGNRNYFKKNLNGPGRKLSREIRTSTINYVTYKAWALKREWWTRVQWGGRHSNTEIWPSDGMCKPLGEKELGKWTGKASILVPWKPYYKNIKRKPDKLFSLLKRLPCCIDIGRGNWKPATSAGLWIEKDNKAVKAWTVAQRDRDRFLCLENHGE